MNEPLEIGAGVRELLGELARDETARLLCVSPRQRELETLERHPFVSSGTPSLNQVERKLLECHREEVARLLYRYAVLAAFELPGVGRRQHYADNSPLPDSSELGLRATHSLSKGSLHGHDLGHDLRVLENCLGASAGSPLAILVAAARFAPSAAIRIAQGSNWLQVEGDGRRAEEVLARAADQGGELASYALEGLGAVAADRGDYRLAMQMYERAVLADPDRPMPKLAWLRFSYRSGAHREIEASAQQVDSSLHSSDAAVRWYLGLSGSAGLDPDPRPLRVAGIPERQFGMISRAVIHES